MRPVFLPYKLLLLAMMDDTAPVIDLVSLFEFHEKYHVIFQNPPKAIIFIHTEVHKGVHTR